MGLNKTDGTSIHVIGLDCDDPRALEKLIRKDPSLLKKAAIICAGASLHGELENYPEYRGRLLKLTIPLEPLYDTIFDLSRKGLRVVVLADGDPLFFGIGASLVKRAPDSDIQITPAVSTLQAACARLKIPWHNVYCISLHGRDDIAPLYDAITAGHTICILTGGAATPDGLASMLLDRGVDWFEAHIFERMGSPDEVAVTLSLKDCAKNTFGPSPTPLLIPDQKLRSPSLGLEENRFRGSYATKKPVRGAILELLKIGSTHTVWDVGAGSGILSLESCVLAHEGRVIAIEKNLQRCLDIQENRKLLGAVNLDLKAGSAPDAFAGLPRPQRIFVGGGLNDANAANLLQACASALPRGGRLVAGCANSGAFQTCRDFMDGLGWPLEMMQIQASDALPEMPGGQIPPAHPVFLLATQKP